MANPLLKALEELAPMVRKVDIGDVTRKIDVPARLAALGDMVGDAGKSVTKKADDWGWKGGKPGEITGREYNMRLNGVDDDALSIVKAEGLSPEDALYGYYGDPTRELFEAERNRIIEGLSKRAKKQLEPAFGKLPTANDVNVYMDQFARLEKADIPRKWTGKVVKSLNENNVFLDEGFAPDWVSSSMRGLTDTQRRDFLRIAELSPEVAQKGMWEDVYSPIAEFAARLQDVPKAAREDFFRLLPRSKVSLEKTLETAIRLNRPR